MSNDNSRGDNGKATADFPVIRTEADLLARHPHSKAYVLVTPALVVPVWLMFKTIYRSNLEGQLYRGIELLLIGLEVDDHLMMTGGAKQIVQTLFLMNVLKETP